jgi:hypothetical protein
VTESLRTFRSAREREGRAQAEVLQVALEFAFLQLLMKFEFDPIWWWGCVAFKMINFRSDLVISPIASPVHHPG